MPENCKSKIPMRWTPAVLDVCGMHSALYSDVKKLLGTWKILEPTQKSLVVGLHTCNLAFCWAHVTRLFITNCELCNSRWLPMASILPRHALNTLLLVSQVLHVTAQLVCIHISMRAIYIENKKNYRYYVIRVQRSKTVFLPLWPINQKIFAPVLSNLANKCSLSALMNIWNVGWIQPIDEQKLVIVDIKKQDHWQQRNPATSHVILD